MLGLQKSLRILTQFLILYLGICNLFSKMLEVQRGTEPLFMSTYNWPKFLLVVHFMYKIICDDTLAIKTCVTLQKAFAG